MYVCVSVFIYLERAHVGEGQEGKENLEKTGLSTEPDVGLDLTTLRSGREPTGSWTLNRVSPNRSGF